MLLVIIVSRLHGINRKGSDMVNMMTNDLVSGNLMSKVRVLCALLMMPANLASPFG